MTKSYKEAVNSITKSLERKYDVCFARFGKYTIAILSLSDKVIACGMAIKNDKDFQHKYIGRYYALLRVIDVLKKHNINTDSLYDFFENDLPDLKTFIKEWKIQMKEKENE